MGTVCGLPPGQQYPLPGIVQYFSIRPCQVCPHVTQGNRIWDFLDIRVAEKARVCLLSTSSGANWMVHGPQNGGFRQPQFDLCRRNHLHDLRSVPEKSKCDCPACDPTYLTDKTVFDPNPCSIPKFHWSAYGVFMLGLK